MKLPVVYRRKTAVKQEQVLEMEAHYCRLIYKNPTSVTIYNHYPTLLFPVVDGCERQILRLVSKNLI